MKWARLLAALGKLAAGLFVKNPAAQQQSQVIGQAVDIAVEAVAETAAEGKEEPK